MGHGIEVPDQGYAVNEEWESNDSYSHGSSMRMQPRPEPGSVYSKPHILEEDHHMQPSPMHYGGKWQGQKVQQQSDHRMQTSPPMYHGGDWQGQKVQHQSHHHMQTSPPMYNGGNWQGQKVQHQSHHHLQTSPPMYYGGNWQGQKVPHQSDWYGPKPNHVSQYHGYGPGYDHKPVIPASHESISFDEDYDDFYRVPMNMNEGRYEYSSWDAPGAHGYMNDERYQMTSGGHRVEWVNKGI